MRRLGLTVLLCIALWAGVPVDAAGQPAPVRCGQTITTDTTLHRDLVDCPNNGIVIGADDITLDLNGHRIDGDDRLFAGCGDGEFCDIGLLNDGHDGVVVRQGALRDFALGALVYQARHNRVVDVSAASNRFVGFGLVEASQSVVRDSSGNRNGGGDGDGMFLLGSHDVKVLYSSFLHNGQLGLHIGESTNNLVKGNVFAHNPTTLLIEGNRNQVRYNRIRYSDGNVFVLGDRNVIARNRISRPARGARGPGVAIENGRYNRIAHNVIADVRVGIRLGLVSPRVGGSHNILRWNLVRATGQDAFEVEREDNGSLLKHNVAIGAGGDGFDIKGPRTTLTGNQAVRNADLGIEATPAVIDGGGNIARGNGDPRQCLHISCA